ncbi:MAG: FliM/FliN family flagellar motor switch protein [Pseudomonadota bacterium]
MTENALQIESAQSEPTQAPAATAREITASPIPLSQLPVSLRFEVGHIDVSLDRLARVRPGSTFSLEHPLGKQTIHVVANGSLIAKGELVSLGDSLGVRVTHVCHDITD